MKRLLAMIATAAWALALPIAATSHTAQAVAAPARQAISCPDELFDYGVHFGVTPAFFGVDWETNSCDWWVQARIKCSGGLGTAYFKSGPVQGIESVGNAYCTASYPNPQAGYSRVSTDNKATWSAWKLDT